MFTRLLFQNAPQQFIEERNDETSDDKDNQRTQDAPTNIHTGINEALDDSLQLVSPFLRRHAGNGCGPK